jgi:hypothetical protein
MRPWPSRPAAPSTSASPCATGSSATTSPNSSCKGRPRHLRRQTAAELSAALRGQGVSNSGRRQLYGYLAFYRAYPQIVRTASALSAPTQAPAPAGGKSADTVRTICAAARHADPETLLNRLSYSHLEQLVELRRPAPAQLLRSRSPARQLVGARTQAPDRQPVLPAHWPLHRQGRPGQTRPRRQPSRHPPPDHPRPLRFRIPRPQAAAR